MSRSQEFNNYVSSRQPAALCNKCIANGLGWPNDAAHPNQIAAALATTSDFSRERGNCSNCHNNKLVIRANRR